MAQHVPAPTEFTRTYWARASNAAGTVDSATATVTVWKVFSGHRAARDMVKFEGRWYAANGRSVMVSEDGREWAVLQEASLAEVGAEQLTVGEGMLLASSRSGHWGSLDGVNWKKLSYGGSGCTGYSGNAVFGAGVWVSTLPDIRWSVDAREWNYIENSPSLVRDTTFADARFVAVGADIESFDEGEIHSSFDGKNWTDRTPAWSAELTRLNAITHGDGRFVAVGEGGTIVRSLDALEWTVVSPIGASDHEFTSVVWGAGRFVAGVSGTNTVWWSEDGATWQEAIGPERLSGDYVHYIDGQFRAEGASGWAFESPDGVEWQVVSGWPRLGTDYSQNSDEALPGLAAGNGLFMLLEPNPRYSEEDTPAYVSVDGIDWREVASPGYVFDRLIHYNGWFIASAEVDGGFGLRISRDGVSWETSLVLTNNTQIARFIRTKEGLVAISNQSGMFRSSDGENWEQLPYDFSFSREILAASDSRFVTTGYRAVYVSSDLAHGALVDFPFDYSRFDGAAYGNGRFVLGTQFLSKFYSSTDGITWEPQVGPELSSHDELVFVDGRFLALGNSRISSSRDGLSWRTPPGFLPHQKVTQLGGTTLLAGGTHLAIAQRDPAVGGIVTVAGSLIVAEGDPVRLAVEAVGHDLDYQWYRGEEGDTSQPLDQGTGAALEVAPEEITGGAVFWVRVTSGAQSWSSESLLVQVFSAPEIATHPVGQLVPLEGSISLNVAATGAGMLHYQWWRDGTRLENSDFAVLVLDAAHEEVGGEYVAVAYDEYGVSASESALLEIPDVPEIVTEPTALAVSVGATAEFAVEAQGLSLFYQWRRNGLELPDETTAVLIVAQVDGSDAGIYDVAVRNRGGSVTSVPARLTVEGSATLAPAFVVGSGMINSSGNRLGHMPFRIEGKGIKRVLLRVLGPAMAADGDSTSAWVRDPNLILRDRTGAAIVANDDWADAVDGGDAVRLANTMSGAMPLAEGSADAALVVELTPGSYTLEFDWLGSGRVVPEVWDLDVADEPSARLASLGLFSRIASTYYLPSLTFVVPSPGGREVVSRHLGPALEREDAMRGPRLQLTSGGSSPVIVGSATGWEASDWPTWLLDGLRGLPMEPNEYDAMRIDRLTAGTHQLIGITSRYDTGFGLLEVVDPLAAESPAEIVVLVPAVSQTVLAGYDVRFEVLAAGPRERSYQWNLDEQPIEGASSASLLLAEVQPEREGDYTLTIFTEGETLTTAPVVLTVIGGGPVRAAHSIAVSLVALGETARISVELEWDDRPVDLAYRVELPEGWTLESDDASAAVEVPAVGAAGPLGWRFGSLTGSGALSFSFVVRVPEAADRYNSIMGEVVHAGLGGSEVASEALPYYLGVGAVKGIHDADTDRDRRFGLSELLRVIELYNTRFGTTRTGRYRLSESTDDGYAPESSSDEAADLASYHSADVDHDERFSLSELLRVIEIYNTRSGTTRTGAYRISGSTVDGFSPDS